MASAMDPQDLSDGTSLESENPPGRSSWARRHILAALSTMPIAGLATPSLAAPAAATSTAPLSWRAQKRKSRVNGLDMAYYEIGHGDPIVFLHGNPTSSYLWRNIIPHAAPYGRCIAPDMIGMGDSAPLPDSGPGRYTFQTHRDYLFGLLQNLGVRQRVTLVAHDWGSAMAFHWAQQNADRVKGIAFMEALLRPEAQQMPAPTSGPFLTFRSPAGEAAVLQQNLFVEQLLIAGLSLYLTEDDKAEYRRPYLMPGESRRPTLEWPRELPLGGEPRRNDELMLSYTQWLAADARIPKLFIRAAPGAILADPARLAFVRTFKNQREVTVYGPHFVQEVSPDAIGRALAAWLPTLA